MGPLNPVGSDVGSSSDLTVEGSNLSVAVVATDERRRRIHDRIIGVPGALNDLGAGVWVVWRESWPGLSTEGVRANTTVGGDAGGESGKEGYGVLHRDCRLLGFRRL